jgi:hypothetical protein
VDKETLSNYGWIVICTLVLAVMIALATPFGEYVKDAVWSTTNGLNDTLNKNMQIVGLSNSNNENVTDKYDNVILSIKDLEFYDDGDGYIYTDMLIEELQFKNPIIEGTKINIIVGDKIIETTWKVDPNDKHDGYYFGNLSFEYSYEDDTGETFYGHFCPACSSYFSFITEGSGPSDTFNSDFEIRYAEDYISWISEQKLYLLGRGSGQGSGYQKFYAYYFNDIAGFKLPSETESFSLKFNETTYENLHISYFADSDSGETICYIGNLSIYNSNWNNTGEDFCIFFGLEDSYLMNLGGYEVIFITHTDGEPIVSLQQALPKL